MQFPWIRPTMACRSSNRWRPRLKHGKGLSHVNATFVGLDVHAQSIKAVALGSDRRNQIGTFAYDGGKSRRVVGSRPCREVRLRVRRHRVRPAEEAHGAGRRLRRRRGLVSSLGRRKRKNDRNDAEFLVRALEDARETGAATAVESSSSGMVTCSTRPPDRAQEGQLDRGPLGVDQVDIVSREGRRRRPLALRRRRRQAMEGTEEAGGWSRQRRPKPRWKKRIDSLRCLKGVDTMTAADIAFETGEFSRFKSARSFAARSQAHPLRALQRGEREAGRHHQGRQQTPATGCLSVGSAILNATTLKATRQRTDSDPAAKAYNQGVRRLVKRREGMLERGVRKNKANVATARELACWCWAIGCMVERLDIAMTS